MELRHLRYFIAVADELHFGRAADKLHMAQPPLSMQIRQLEEEIGVELFSRSRRRVELTEAGKVFQREAKRVLAQAEHAVRAAQQAGRGEVGRLALAFVASAPFNVLPQIIREFRKAYPQVELVLHEMASGAQIHALREGRIDIGFVRTPLDAPDLAMETILREPLVVAIPEGHALAKKKKISLEQLEHHTFVMVPRTVGPGLHDLVMAMCFRAGFRPQVVQEATEMQTIVGLVGAGLGVSLVPSSVANIHGTGVVYRPLTASPSIDMALAWRRENPSAGIKAFLEVARQHVAV